MVNNCKNIYCNLCNIYYNKALRIYSSFIFFRVKFICVAYLFSLTVCLKNSSSILLRAKFRISYTYLNTILYFSITLIYVNHFWLYNIFMKLCGDVEENPGPKPSSNQIFSICHWNLNSISAHNYIKLSLKSLLIHSQVWCNLFIWYLSWLWYIPWRRQSRNSRLHFNLSRSSF